MPSYVGRFQSRRQCKRITSANTASKQELFAHPQASLLFADLISSKSQLSPEEPRSRSDRVRLAVRGYRATTDSPGCDIYQDLMALYPKAKVILSVRDNDEAWWKSFSSVFGSLTTRRHRWLIYPVPSLRAQNILLLAITERWMRLAGTDTLGPSIHRVHNEDVMANVPREKLLVFNVKMGWNPLCEFLDVPVPEQPFPNMSVIPPTSLERC